MLRSPIREAQALSPPLYVSECASFFIGRRATIGRCGATTTMTHSANTGLFVPRPASAVVKWLVFPPVTRKTRAQFPAAEMSHRESYRACARAPIWLLSIAFEQLRGLGLCPGHPRGRRIYQPLYSRNPAVQRHVPYVSLLHWTSRRTLEINHVS